MYETAIASTIVYGGLDGAAVDKMNDVLADHDADVCVHVSPSCECGRNCDYASTGRGACPRAERRVWIAARLGDTHEEPARKREIFDALAAAGVPWPGALAGEDDDG